MNTQENVDIRCPYCGEQITLIIDRSADSQEYIEDCQVCCQPINLHVRIEKNRPPAIVARRDSD